MTSPEYLDCEVFVTGRDQARLTAAGKDYSGRPALDTSLEERLLEVSLDSTKYGRLLFEALFHGEELAIGYRESLTIARRENQRLRLRLHIAATAPAALHRLHWELLYDPRQKIALSRSSETAFSRYLGTTLEPTAVAVAKPRLLVVLSAPSDQAEYGLTPIDVVQQRQALERALAPLADRLTIGFLEGPATIESVRDRLVAGNFHALHLQAHGHLDPDQETASLVMEDEKRRASFVDAELLSEVFEGQRHLRLVTLIACHGGAPATANPFSGLGRALVGRGIPAVLTMRQEVGLESATRFSEHFYRNLARSDQIDTAANEARLQLHLAEPESDAWGKPALFMHLQDGRLWEPEVSIASDPQAKDTRSTAQTTVLRTLLTIRTQSTENPTDDEVTQQHARLIRDLLRKYGGREVANDDSYLLVFERPIQAVKYALACHLGLDELLRATGAELAVGIAIHLGEILLQESSEHNVEDQARPIAVEGPALDIARKLLPTPTWNQTLLTRSAFDVARASLEGETQEIRELRWLAHGEYHLPKHQEPLEIFEVGVKGFAPLVAPRNSEKLSQSLGQETIPGWRPALGLALPERPHWIVEKRLGEGGFGEVWLAAHGKTGEKRVFKFCYETSRLRALQREITLFRLLKEELGHRDDIARILDWNFDEPPYFIESEYAADGDLAEWTEEQGHLKQVSLEQRLEIVAQAATALAAAHSVGVLHKDVKPSNVLIGRKSDGSLKVQLSDFGIGAVTDRERLLGAGITVLGLTTEQTEKPSSASGTRLYMAPELLEGKRATLQTDIYALGVMLYQMVVGDLTKALASGWQRDIEDELLSEDIAFAVDGSPERRLGNALRVAERLRTLNERRQALEQSRREQEEALQTKLALKKSRRRRRSMAIIITLLALFGGAMTFQNHRINTAREQTALEARNAQEISNFLVDLFGQSDPGVAKGETLTARQLLDKGAAQIRDELNDQPLTQARLMDTMGTIYRELGHYDLAKGLFDEALETLREHLDGDHIDIAKSLGHLAEVHRLRGDLSKAEKLLKQALRIWIKERGDDHPDVAGALNNLALIYNNQGRLEEAEKYYLRVLEIFERQKDIAPLKIASLTDNLCSNYNSQRRFEEAAPYCRQGLEIREELLGPEHHLVSRSFNNLAIAYSGQGLYSKAEEIHLRALTSKTKVLGPGHLKVAIGENNLAGVYLAQGRRREAEKYFNLALGTFQEIFEPDHQYIAHPLFGLAKIYRDEGRTEEAAETFQRALKIRKSLPAGHPDREETIREFALFLRSIDRTQEAEKLEAQLTPTPAE